MQDRGFVLFLVVTLLVTAVIAVATISLVTTAVVRAGMIYIDVTSFDEHARVRLSLPAFPANLVLRAIDLDHIEMNDREMFEKVAKVAQAELHNLPDTTFVEVTDGRDHVRIRSLRRGLAIDIEDRDARVSVHIPASTVRKLAQAVR